MIPVADHAAMEAVMALPAALARLDANAARELRKVSVGGEISADRLIAGGDLHGSIRALVAELNRLRGCGLMSAPGTDAMDVPLGDATVTLEFSYRAAVPGRTWGPPEDCYPDEPEEIEIVGVLVNGAMVDADQFDKTAVQRWEELVRERVAELAQQAADDAAEARAEERRYA